MSFPQVLVVGQCSKKKLEEIRMVLFKFGFEVNQNPEKCDLVYMRKCGWDTCKLFHQFLSRKVQAPILTSLKQFNVK